MKLFINLFLALVVIVFGITFALKNTASVQIDYYLGWQWTGSLSWLLVMTLVIGAIIGVLFTLGWVLKSKRQVSTLRKELNQLEQEASSLRSIPVQDDS